MIISYDERLTLANELVRRADRLDDSIMDSDHLSLKQANEAARWSVTLRRSALALRESTKASPYHLIKPEKNNE